MEELLILFSYYLAVTYLRLYMEAVTEMFSFYTLIAELYKVFYLGSVAAQFWKRRRNVVLHTLLNT